MSRDHRDQSRGHPVRRRGLYGCLCCPVLSPASKSRSRATRDRALDQVAMLEVGEGETYDLDPHVYVGERCVRCNVNVYDADLPGLEDCSPKNQDAPITYTTTTGQGVQSSHDIAEWYP